MNNRTRSKSSQRGVSLILALIAILVLGILAATIVATSQAQTWTALNYRLTTQSRYAAEAGVQATMNWLANSYTAPSNFAPYTTTANPVQYNNNPVVLSGISGVSANYPDATVSSAYNTALSGKPLTGIANASYSTSATLLRMTPAAGVSWLGGGAGVAQTWQITSTGSIGGLRPATVQLQATYERTETSVSSYAVFATGTTCPTVTFSGGSQTDSYDSSVGTYAATVQASNGNVGTNGNLTLSGGTTVINGTASLPSVTSGGCPNSFTNSSGAGAVQGTVAMGGPKNFANPVYTNPSPAIVTSTNYSSDQNLGPGNYGNIAMSGHKTLTLSPGTYNFNSLTLSGNSVLTVNPPGVVVIEIAGAGSPSKATDFSGGSITNGSGVPANFQIVYSGSAPIVLSGGSSSAAVVYAPNADVTMSGHSPWFGSIVAKTLDDSGGSVVHFDRALLNNFTTAGPFKQVSFTWNKY